MSQTFKMMSARAVVAMTLGGALLGAAACGSGPETTAAAAPAAEQTRQAAAAAPIGQTIWLKACATNLYVSADKNLTSTPLVANRTSTAGWELFKVADAGSGYISLQVQETGLYVSANPNASGQVTGYIGTVGDWERFQWVGNADGTVSLKSKSTGQFVSSDVNQGSSGPLYANRATAGCWEAFSFGSTAAPAGKWVQIWSDEFNGTSLDTTNWAYNTSVHVNNEQEQYTNSSQNVSVSNGTLKLTVRYQPTNGYPYTSGRIESAGKREFNHSRVEARIKMPVGAGLWPAFWMLGNDINSVGWPQCGELDIMENVGYSDWTSGALHGPGYYGNTPITGRFYPNSSVSNFHVYRTEFSTTDVKWYIDDVLVKTATKGEINQYGTYVYDHPFYIILNLAIGGGYPQGQNGATSPYPGVPQSTATLVAQTPQTMEVDYVRVYQWQ